MSQVELPQVSLQRYVDLVKRRRWQVVPVSLLGLLLGGLIAFFIPRFYVAELVLWHESVEGLLDERADDPFRSLVQSATDTIPLAARKVMEKMKWPELAFADGHAVAQLEKDVQSRIKTYDGNAGDRKRSFAKIGVSYRDRDGKRAADFLNLLVTTWIDSRIAELSEPREKERRRAHDEASRWGRTFEDLLQEKRDLEIRYGIDPTVDPATQRKVFADGEAALRELEAKAREKAVELQALDAQLDKWRTAVAAMPERVAPDVERLLEQAKATEEGKRLLVQRDYQKIALSTFKPGTRYWRSQQRQLEEVERRIKELVAPPSTEADGLIPNPDLTLLQTQLELAETQRVTVAAELGSLAEAVVADRLRREAKSAGWAEYERKLAQLLQAQQSRDTAAADRAQAEQSLARLGSEVPIRPLSVAAVPPRPTEPNILVVALIGCVLGLAAAVGLILLLDILQGTFKTVEDVEQGLSVPVLGGISHLETEEERVVAVRSRRRASLYAFGIAGLLAVVIAIFYVDPTALPAVVRDVLGLVLGS